MKRERKKEGNKIARKMENYISEKSEKECRNLLHERMKHVAMTEFRYYKTNERRKMKTEKNSRPVFSFIFIFPERIFDFPTLNSPESRK